MEKDTNAKFAKKNFKVLCKFLDKKKWKYEKAEENYKVRIPFAESGYTVYVILWFNLNLGIFSAMTWFDLPEIPESKRTLMAAAITFANGKLTDGNFDYNCLKNKICFRMATSFIESMLSESLYDYMISVAYHTTKEYLRKFVDLYKNEFKTVNQLKNYVCG